MLIGFLNLKSVATFLMSLMSTKVKPWSGKHKNSDPRFMIKEDAIVEANDNELTGPVRKSIYKE